jgi:hypothetical protein
MVRFAFIVEGMSYTEACNLERDRRVRAIPPRNVRELAGALVEVWGNISRTGKSGAVHEEMHCST